MVFLITPVSQILGISQWIIWIILILAILYIYGTWTYSTFKKMDVPGPTPLPLIGNFLHLIREGFRMDLKLGKKYGSVYGYYEGVIPVLVISEPEYIKQIAVKNFDYFVDRRQFLTNKEVRKFITVVKADEWKNMRNAMTPSFSGGKIKKMAGTIDDCAERLVANLQKFADKGDMFEIRHIVGCFTMDVVAETLFGIQVNSQDNYNNEFVMQARKAFEEMTFGNPALIVTFFAPFLKNLLEFFGFGALKQDTISFFYNKVESILKMRKNMNEKPLDFLQLLLDAHADETPYVEEKLSALEETTDTKNWRDAAKRALTEDEIIQNSLLFFLVGYETTASTIGWMIYNLSLNEDAQEKLYEDVMNVFEKYKTADYEAIAKMTYLDQVFCETLRLYPPAMRTDRTCNADCDIGPYHIPKDMIINISIVGAHYSEEYWSEREKFDPDRFSPENRDKIVPYSFLPFGVGPRNCIGMRLATLEAKIAMAYITKNFKIKRCEKTEVPIKIRNVGLTIPVNGIWVRLEHRK
jgi:cytochrome P450 family 3 subfamily A